LPRGPPGASPESQTLPRSEPRVSGSPATGPPLKRVSRISEPAPRVAGPGSRTRPLGPRGESRIPDPPPMSPVERLASLGLAPSERVQTQPNTSDPPPNSGPRISNSRSRSGSSVLKGASLESQTRPPGARQRIQNPEFNPLEPRSEPRVSDSPPRSEPTVKFGGKHGVGRAFPDSRFDSRTGIQGRAAVQVVSG
jgi:hypothetical protein